MPSVTLVSFRTVGKQDETVAVMMFQEFKNAKSTLSLSFPAMSLHTVPTSHPLSSPRGAHNEKGFGRHLCCVSLSGHPTSKASLMIFLLSTFPSASQGGSWSPHLRVCTPLLGHLVLELQVQWPGSRRVANGDCVLLLPTAAGPGGWVGAGHRESPVCGSHHQLHPSWLTTFLALLGGPVGPTLCCCLGVTLSTSQAPETPGSHPELAQSTHTGRKQRCVPGLGVTPLVTSEEGMWKSGGSTAEARCPMVGSASKDPE